MVTLAHPARRGGRGAGTTAAAAALRSPTPPAASAAIPAVSYQQRSSRANITSDWTLETVACRCHHWPVPTLTRSVLSLMSLP